MSGLLAVIASRSKNAAGNESLFRMVRLRAFGFAVLFQGMFCPSYLDANLEQSAHDDAFEV